MVGASLIEAYLDESGTHTGAPILAVAGFFGIRGKWDAFLEKWPYLEFHACESRFDSIKSQLMDAIDAAELEGIEACIIPQDFKTFASQDLKNTLGNAYAIAAYSCAVKICDIVKTSSDAKISFVLEDGQPNVEWVERLLLAMMDRYPIASVSRAKKSEFTQLHTADLLAHSRSTTDTKCLDRLFAEKRVSELPLTVELLETTSTAISQLLKRHRNQRARTRRAKKAEMIMSTEMTESKSL